MNKPQLLSAALLSLILLQGCESESKKSSPAPSIPPTQTEADKPLVSTIKQPELSDLSKLEGISITEGNARFIAQLTIDAIQSNLPTLTQYKALREASIPFLLKEEKEQNTKSACAEQITDFKFQFKPIVKREKVSLKVNNCLGAENTRLNSIADVSADDKSKITLQSVEKANFSQWLSGPRLVLSTQSNDSETRYDNLLLSRHNLERFYRGTQTTDAFIISTIKGSIYSSLLGGKISFTSISPDFRSVFKRDGDNWKLTAMKIRLAGKVGESLLIELKDGNLTLSSYIKRTKKKLTTTTLADLKTNAKAYHGTQLQDLKDKNSTLNEKTIDALLAQPYFNHFL